MTVPALLLAVLAGTAEYHEVTTFGDGSRIVERVTWETQLAGAFIHYRDVFGRTAVWYTTEEPEGEYVQVCASGPGGYDLPWMTRVFVFDADGRGGRSTYLRRPCP